MEHPEKALFDEVRGLRTSLEDSKERIAEVEKEYQSRVIFLEKRCEIDESCHDKLESWKELCKNKINFYLNEKVYTFYRSTFYNNIYPVSQTFLPKRDDSVILETNKGYFKALIEIIRIGNEAFLTESKKRNYKDLLDKSLRDNTNLVSFIKTCFDENIFLHVCGDFGLNYSYLGKGSDEDLLESFTIENRYTTMMQHELTDIKTLAYKKNSQGLFLNYNAEFTITLTETVRTGKIVIKPFTNDSSLFAPTNGNSNALIFSSLDGRTFDYLVNVPANYGSYQNNYFTEIYLQELTSFKYLKFKTTSSSLFSLSYLGFKLK
jgi:hypothetical protein